MQARVKPLVLPGAPHYEGNVGPVWSRPWYEAEKDLIVVTVSPRSGALPSCHHDAKKGPGRPRKPKSTQAKKNRMKATKEEITQVRKFMDTGKSTKEIAEAIGKPDYTVRRYKRQIRAGIAGKE